jgi:polyribonucleotide nucleotidyltransferase
LGSPEDKQVMDELTGEYKERFLLHYNFPGYATGEPKPERSPGRREIGHGNLARRGLKPILPEEKDFPYAIRIVPILRNLTVHLQWHPFAAVAWHCLMQVYLSRQHVQV